MKQIASSGGSSPAQFTALGNKVFFSAGLTNSEPYVSDGTFSGTFRLGDLVPGSTGSNPRLFAAANGRMYFQASGGDAFVNNAEMWTSDGTVAGTFRVADVNTTSTSSQPGSFVPLGSQVLLTAAGSDGRELYVSNGISGAQLFQDLYLGGSSNPKQLVASGGKVFFTAFTPAHGRELYCVTPGGTPQLLADIMGAVSDGGPTDVTPYKGGVIFDGPSDNFGGEPWVSDGTPAGTVPLADIAPGLNSFGTPLSSFAYAFQPYKGKELFAAQSTQSGPFALYVTGGTPGDVQKLHDIQTGTSLEDNLIRVVGDRILWQGRTAHNDAGLWVSDGNSASLLLDLYPTNSRGQITELLPVGNWLLVVSQDTMISGGGGFELWLTDGSSTNTFRLTSSEWPDIADLTLAGNTVFFRGNSGFQNIGDELYGLNVSTLVPEPSTATGLALLAAAKCLRRRDRRRVA